MSARPAPAGATGGGRDFSARLMTPLLLGSVLNPINTTMISTGLVAIGRDFGVGPAGTSWLVAVLYLACAVAQPAAGRIADLFGPRRAFLCGLVLVVAAGLVGALAPGFGWLLASRLLLGVGTSTAYPSALAMLRARSRQVGRPAPRSVLGLLSLAGMSSAAVGPVLGGVLTATTGWRGIFAVNVPLALLGLVLAVVWLPRDQPRSARQADGAGSGVRELDPLGMLLFFLTLVPGMFFLLDLAHPAWYLLPVVVVVGAVFTRWQLRRPRPFLDLRSLGSNRALTTTYLRHGLSYLVIYCVMYGFTQWLEEGHGLSSFHTGLTMLPMSVTAAVCSLLGARTRGIRAPLTTAAVLLAGGSALLAVTGSGAPWVVLLLAGALFGVPQGLVSTGNQAAVYSQSPPEGTGSAAGLQRSAQYLGAITAASLIALFYGQRADDAGLHELALVTGVLSLVLIVLTVTDRALRRPRSGQAPPPAPASKSPAGTVPRPADPAEPTAAPSATGCRTPAPREPGTRA
ncbi:MFS transporter [Streptomyces sp. NPDC059740]|uniref:MFS transporter n=1 Tax=Streptomyces sp. NPDC059740 TaxID=3346926 RepID=UPI00365F944C